MQRFFTFMILLVVFLGSAPGQGNSDAVLARLGKIEVHSLPHANHGNGPLRSGTCKLTSGGKSKFVRGPERKSPVPLKQLAI
jgi:hypothetical protein